jgi:hypothetical protein
MTVINISWYLCLLFIVALVAESAITVAPGGEVGARILMGTWAGLAVLFATVAVTFSRLRLSEPRWLVRAFQGVALVATVAVILMVVG